MDQLMWVVTFAALTLAVGMTAVAVRLLSSDRRRTAARVASLEAAALSEDDGELQEYETIDADIEEEFDEPPFREPAFDDFRGADVAMFGATVEPKPPSRRWLAVSAVAIVMAGLIGTAYTLFKPESLGAAGAAPATPASTAAAARTAAPTAAPAPPPATPDLHQPPIELLSLKHTVDGSTFSIAGLVQNPIGGVAMPHVIAVVYLFDNDGAYFATGRAELEFQGLRPGEESPFTVKIPGTARVGRYRVGFRRDDGSVIQHVDKRGQASAALMTEGK